MEGRNSYQTEDKDRLDGIEEGSKIEGLLLKLEVGIQMGLGNEMKVDVDIDSCWEDQRWENWSCCDCDLELKLCLKLQSPALTEMGIGLVCICNLNRLNR